MIKNAATNIRDIKLCQPLYIINMHLIPQITFDFIGIVFLIFCGAVFVQLFYLFWFHLRLLFFKGKNKTEDLKPVSVIICARNEEDNLFKHLPAVLEQDYPEFEVIVVNDQSVDDSRHIVKAYQKKYANLKLIELEKNKHRKFGKKVPLTVGIKGATYANLAMIDADCYPKSNQWLKRIMGNYAGEKEIVIGYGPYEKQKGVLNKFIRFDAVTIALTYLGFARSGIPYMAVGRNMSYSKTLFFNVGGFKRHYHIQSGDDDLFMQEAANRKNVAIEIDPDSFVYSKPENTWKSWFKQKQRHYTTAPKYRLINKFFLGIFPVSMIFMLISFFILLFKYEWWLFVTALLVFRFLSYWLVNGLLLRKFQMQDLVFIYPIYELLHFFMMPFVYYSSERTETSRW